MSTYDPRVKLPIARLPAAGVPAIIQPPGHGRMPAFHDHGDHVAFTEWLSHLEAGRIGGRKSG